MYLKNEIIDMEIVKIKDDHIKLGQALKLAGLVESGVDAKMDIKEGLVKVNGEVELQRGKKIFDGDVIEYEGQKFMVKSELSQ